MTETVRITREGRTGIVTLDRPRAINALDTEMIAGITDAFLDFTDDDRIAAIIIEGAGERGFCAGGDVRAVRQHLIDGQKEAAEQFFVDEYALNGMLATSEKPLIALTDGIVMGGGLGLAGHAGYRIATDRAKFAMPESAIGFVCDVGTDWILAKAPLNRALAFLMSGVTIAVADALALGLTDCVVPHDKLDEVRNELLIALETGDAPTSIVTIMQAFSVEPGEAEFCARADRLNAALTARDARAIYEALEALAPDDEDAAALFNVLKTRCPFSLVAIEKSQRAARGLGDINAVLNNDLKLARLMISRDDFSEGVRAVLVDKDQSARWSPSAVSDVDMAAIATCLEG